MQVEFEIDIYSCCQRLNNVSKNHWQWDFSYFTVTTKKRGYPSVFKTAGIAPKSAGIGSKFLSQHFFSWRFKPLGNECGYRVARPVLALFKSAGKGIHPIPALLKALPCNYFQFVITTTTVSIQVYFQ